MKKFLLVLAIFLIMSSTLTSCTFLQEIGKSAELPEASDNTQTPDVTVNASSDITPAPDSASPDLSEPFPSSERLENADSMVTGSYEDLVEIVITKAELVIDLDSDQAAAVFDYLSNVDTVTAPNPIHYEMFTVDPIYTITLFYSNGTSDIIRTGSEVENSMYFYRTLPEMGTSGDHGFVYFKDENNEFLELITSLI